MSLKVYIAAAYVDRNRALACMRWVAEQPGLEVAHNWIAAIDKRRAEGHSESSLSPQQRREHAHEDLAAMRKADVFWFLAPKEGGRGSWFEAGVAYAEASSGAPFALIVSGPHYGDSIFTELFERRFVDDAEAFAYLKATVPE